MKTHPWKSTDKLSALVTTFFGSGTLPKMPGTYGSLAAAIIAYPIAFLKIDFLLAALSVLVFFLSIPFVSKAMRDSNTEDPGWIVIDEVAGQWLALAFVPAEWILTHPWSIFLAFALFRFFDILKPLGIKRLEKLPGAWGVMADDILGGFYAGILVGVFRFALFT